MKRGSDEVMSGIEKEKAKSGKKGPHKVEKIGSMVSEIRLLKTLEGPQVD